MAVDWKKMFIVGGVAILATIIAAWLSPWYRGMLETGGKTPPSLKQQVS